MWQSTSYKLRVSWWLLICPLSLLILCECGLQGLIIRFSRATTTSICIISGCDNLPPSKVGTIFWLSVWASSGEKIRSTVLTHIHQISSGSWFPGSCHSILLRSDSYDYSHLGMWRSTSCKVLTIRWLSARSLYFLGFPIEKVDDMQSWCYIDC
jgi:hypothetical protein